MVKRKSKFPVKAKSKLGPDYVVTADIFNCAQVGIFLNRDRIDAWRGSKGLARVPGALNAYAVVDTDPAGVDWFSAYIPAECSVETVAHECLHMAFNILESYDVEISMRSHEILAYLQQHLFSQVLARRRK